MSETAGAGSGRRASYVYLHGFASSPGSTKATVFRAWLAARGHRLVVPELAPDFAHTTIAGQLAIAERAVGDGPAVVFGSSLGGWIATILAASRPRAVAALVLFAPAFGFAARWLARLGDATTARWRAEGSLPVFHYATGAAIPLGVAFLDDVVRWPPAPEVAVPALVHAGRDDDLVPLEAIAPWARARPDRELVVWDAGHDLGTVLDPLWERTADWLDRRGLLCNPPACGDTVRRGGNRAGRRRLRRGRPP